MGKDKISCALKYLNACFDDVNGDDVDVNASEIQIQMIQVNLLLTNHHIRSYINSLSILCHHFLFLEIIYCDLSNSHYLSYWFYYHCILFEKYPLQMKYNALNLSHHYDIEHKQDHTESAS